jgi:glycosyltransferase involved in cell wall biosynthesis
MLRALLEAISQDDRFDLEVLICTPKIPGRTWAWNERPGAYPFRWIKGIRLGSFCFNPGILSICFREKFDLFVINSYDQPTSQAAMAVLTFLGRRWAIAGERPGLNPHSPMRNLLRRLALWLPGTYADCAIVTGNLAVQAFERIFKDDRGCYSLPYLIDTSEFLRLPLPDVSAGEVNFLFSGQLIPRKGIDVLCGAAQQVFEREPRARLSIVGEGPERYRVEELLMRFPNRVRLHGFLPFPDRIKAYVDAHVLILPSTHDGWGAVVHEAMARGMPVISSSRVGAAYDLIEDGQNGVMVERNDVDSYSRAMLSFTRWPDKIQVFGARARATASRYTPQWGVQTFLTAVRDVCTTESNERD